MDPLIMTVGKTVSRDVHELVHATQLETPTLDELEPPNWHWGVPLGFASLVAAGALLVAAAGVQESMEERQHHQQSRRHVTKLHKKRVVAQSAPLQN
jgi:hypothetical protein